jgi:hypothetical protein
VKKENLFCAKKGGFPKCPKRKILFGGKFSHKVFSVEESI